MRVGGRSLVGKEVAFGGDHPLESAALPRLLLMGLNLDGSLLEIGLADQVCLLSELGVWTLRLDIFLRASGVQALLCRPQVRARAQNILPEVLLALYTLSLVFAVLGLVEIKLAGLGALAAYGRESVLLCVQLGDAARHSLVLVQLLALLEIA